MARLPIIDSHIHLWPESASNPEGHGWMSEGDLLAKQHILSDYYRAAHQDGFDATAPEVKGVVYVETDRHLETSRDQPLGVWARQPVEEIRFLRSIVEGQYGQRDSRTLLGIVAWAPMDQGAKVFEDWLQLAEQTAGAETWSRIKGFRFLLQGITDRQKFESLVFSDEFITILRSFRSAGRSYSFDVGVDAHSGGVWQLEALVKVIERVNEGTENEEKVIFVLNHLCKPDLSIGPLANKNSDDFSRWSKCIERFASFPNTYMKLSGAFSEFGSERMESNSAQDIANSMRPWLDQLFACFSPQRIMFGSDWPVCNVRGPATEGSWMVWQDVISVVLQRKGLSEQDLRRIWGETAVEAYRLST